MAGALLGGRYRILNLLGKGGMGEVYRATDLTLGQSVALKFLPVEAAANPHLLERFHGEVRVARQVSHPNVCRVYDIGEAEGLPYISMEYVDGDDLAALLQRIGRLPAEKALEIARKLCAGLAAAHSRGVIHRDLKPQNIMLNKRGEVLIMDFGLAAIADQLSGAEARNGTPAYMSPEQLKGIEVTAKSDIYSLGLILYELFTGKKPFEAKSIPQLIAAQESTQLTGMTTLSGEIDPAVEKVVRLCLQPEPGRRPGSALAVAAALPGGDPLAAALAAGETPSPELVAAARGGEGLGRPWALLCLAVVVVCVVGSLIFKDGLNPINLTRHEYPPAVLEQKARDVSIAFGYTKPPLDRATWLARRGAVLSWLSKRSGPKDWAGWLAAESPLVAAYRESPDWLASNPTGLEVGSDNPPPVEPGMVEVKLDGHGKLLNFDAVPYDAPVAGPVAVEKIFEAAGLDFRRFVETEANFRPRMQYDSRAAYKGPHPAIAGVELSVEVARHEGQLTHVLVKGPWYRPPAAPSAPSSRGWAWVSQQAVILFVIGAGVIYAPVLAWRNWHKGRADRRGALRVAVARFAVGVAFWVTAVHPIPHFDLLDQFLTLCGQQLLQAAMLWVLYLALEPALRARWPHSIVTWNRLLAGNWRDPQVAGHILIGCAAGCALWTFFTMRAWLRFDVDGPSVGGAIAAMDGVRGLASGVFQRLKECLSLGLLGFFFLFGARTLLRRDWLAALAGAVMLPWIESGVLNAANRVPMFLLYAVVYAVILQIMLRLGVVATMSTMLFLNLLGAASLGLDPKVWYAPNGLLMIAVILCVAGWSFERSVGLARGLSVDLDAPVAAEDA